MKECLRFLPATHDGWVWRYVYAGRLYAMHRHDELELNLVIRGVATYLVGDQRYGLVRNAQICLFPAQDHVLIDQSPDCEMWMAVFKPVLLQRVCLTPSTQVLLQGNPTGLFSTRLAEQQAIRLGTLFDELVSAAEDTARYNAGLGYLLLSAWAAHLASDQIAVGYDVHPAVEKAAYLIRDEPGLIDLEALARRVGMSASRLSRLFKEQMGVSLVSYRSRQRLKRFLDLYGQGRRTTISAAMLAAGFGSYAQFYRVFTRIMGCGPADYRRKHLKG